MKCVTRANTSLLYCRITIQTERLMENAFRVVSSLKENRPTGAIGQDV